MSVFGQKRVLSKVGHLQWMEKNFRRDLLWRIMPYKICRTLEEMMVAIREFEEKGQTFGVRTDDPIGIVQPYKTPFIQQCDMLQAMELWRDYGDRFLYIVCGNILERFMSGTAVPIDDELVLFEYRIDSNTHQRDMHKDDSFTSFYVGESPYYGNHPLLGKPVLTRENPLVTDLKLDIIYDLVVGADIKAFAFTIRSPVRDIVFW